MTIPTTVPTGRMLFALGRFRAPAYALMFALVIATPYAWDWPLA